AGLPPPRKFWAVQVTVVVPTGKVCGEVITWLPIRKLTIVPSQSGTRVGLGRLTEAVHSPGSAGTVMSAGQVMVGAWGTVTGTMKSQSARLPADCDFIV